MAAHIIWLCDGQLPWTSLQSATSASITAQNTISSASVPVMSPNVKNNQPDPRPRKPAAEEHDTLERPGTRMYLIISLMVEPPSGPVMPAGILEAAYER